MKQFLLPSLWSVVGILLLSSCGQPVCFMGLGDCSKMYDPNRSNYNPTVGLQINGPKTVSIAGGQQRYQAVGGSGYYTYSVLGTANPCGVFISSTNVQIGTFNPVTVGSCTIQAQDNSNSALSGVLTIQITN